MVVLLSHQCQGACAINSELLSNTFKSAVPWLGCLQPPLSGKLSPLDLKTRGLEDMTNASLQRSRQS